MVKRMLIDATHPEETRVVVLDGTRLDEFDLETSTKKQIKGNIYLAKVVRVEPSLQAAFVDYGGNRHGFLAFAEIHPDYYQIPVADRERLMAEAARHEEEEDRRERERHQRRQARDAAAAAGTPLPEGEANQTPSSEEPSASSDHAHDHDHADAPAQPDHDHHAHDHHADDHNHDDDHGDDAHADTLPLAFIPPAISAPISSDDEDAEDEAPAAEPATSQDADVAAQSESEAPAAPTEINDEGTTAVAETKPHVETIGGEDPEEDEEEEENDKQRRRFVASRHYKIQEVIKRLQIMLVQVVKEERGNKGAALTTYLSLAGRYCVLMPNSARGGGVSRKITSAQDRRRLKQIVGELDLPRNMAVILRTAGSERSKPEIKRDYEYLQRTWNNIREVTMQSRAPSLIHEEASLIKRAIRDIYSRDIEEVWVDGDEGYKTAKDFMRMLTPSHAKKVQRYKDDSTTSLFHRYQVESQMESINSPMVQLRSGGSIVFGQTEALVAIDVNSGRATRERHIEETAYKTNMEAAEEIARQLRLRDLAGLVVIDFIDMEDNRNNHAVERKLKDALKVDRARIQVGRISHFGLLELSRQRLRPSLIETNFRVCHHCAGTGLLRSTESAAVHTLRMIEEEGVRRRSSEVTVTCNPEVAIYLLNYKREMLASAETRYGFKVFILGDSSLVAPNLRVDRVKAERRPDEQGEVSGAPALRELPTPSIEIDEADDIEEDEAEDEAPEQTREKRGDGQRHGNRDRDRDRDRNRQGQGQGQSQSQGESDGEGGRKRRRRRRRGGRGDAPPQPQQQAEGVAPQASEEGPGAASEAVDDVNGPSENENGRPEQQGEGGPDGEGRRGRRRGRRGGRRRRRGGENGEPREGNSASPDGEPQIGALDTPFPADRTHPAASNVHPDESYEPARVDTPSDVQDNAEPQGTGERKGFFRGLFGRRNEQQQAEARIVTETRVEAAPQPFAPPPPPPVVVPPPAPPVVAAPPPPPPPPPPPVEEAPAGPPRKGWWQQPGGKTE